MKRSTALTWASIDWRVPSIKIDHAWKDEHEMGLPKWNKIQAVPLASNEVDVLSQLREDSVRVNLTDLVFCMEITGKRPGSTWWCRNFVRTMKRVGIDDRKRNVTPHCLRHSLNTHRPNREARA